MTIGRLIHARILKGTVIEGTRIFQMKSGIWSGAENMECGAGLSIHICQFTLQTLSQVTLLEEQAEEAMGHWAENRVMNS